jgi:hypothetical protein
MLHLKLMGHHAPRLGILLLFLCNTANLFAGEQKDQKSDPAQDTDAPSVLSFKGYLESNLLFHVEPKVAEPEHPLKKNELHSSFKFKYGFEEAYFFLRNDLRVSSGYFGEGPEDSFHYATASKQQPNLTLSSENYEIAFPEAYLNYQRGSVRMRAGNQVFGWGTADIFNPTSYFNPSDDREYFFLGTDQRKIGVPALSLMYLGDSDSLELVANPVHTPGLYADQNSFWGLALDSYQIPVRLLPREQATDSRQSASYGLRYARTISGMDVAVTVFDGIDKDPVYLPIATVALPGSTPTVHVEPRHYRVTAVGLDFSRTAGDVVVQGEIAFSPNKTATIKQKYETVSDIRFPYETKEVQSLSYALGFNYFIPLHRLFPGHEGDSVFTAEWYQTQYGDKDVAAPFLSDIFATRLQDTFAEGRMSGSFTTFYDTRTGDNLLWPAAGYKFDSGLSFDLGYGRFRGTLHKMNETASLFYYLRDKDVVTFTTKYSF